MKDGQKCTNCNSAEAKHSTHKWWETPQDQYLCCKCHVEQGGAPADWHPVCMETYNELKVQTLKLKQ